jgi:hypothetical protein
MAASKNHGARSKMLLETFGTLLRDPNHWLFEFMVGGIEEIVTGVFIGAVIWPRIVRHWHRDAPHRNGVQTVWTPEEIRITELEVGSID